MAFLLSPLCKQITFIIFICRCTKEVNKLNREIQRNQTAMQQYKKHIAEKQGENAELKRTIQIEIEEKENIKKMYE